MHTIKFRLNNMEIGKNQKGSSPAKDKTVTVLGNNNMSPSDITCITYPQEFPFLHKPYPEEVRNLHPLTTCLLVSFISYQFKLAKLKWCLRFRASLLKRG